MNTQEFEHIVFTGLNNDLRVISAPQVLPWPKISSADAFVQVYDWDVMVFNGDHASYLEGQISLCSSIYPCALEILGAGYGAIERITDGSILCLASAGCIGIVLDGLSIVCNDDSRWRSLFVLQGATFKSSYVSFRGCRSDTDGGIVKAYDAAALHIDHCSFENVESLGYGGALAVLGSHAFISNTTFFNCSAAHGGGAIWAMWSSVFQCYGSETSGDTMLYVENSSTFVSCSSSGPGGSILATSDPRALSSKFSSFLETYSSQISVQNIFISIRNTIFSLSKSEKEGGALAVSSNLAVVEVFDTTFRNCSSESNGGAVYAADQASINLSNTSFHGNTAYGIGGGAIYSQNAKLMVSSLTSTGNSALNGGGGMLFWGGSFLPLFSISCSQLESEWPIYSAWSILSTAACYSPWTNSIEALLQSIKQNICGPGNSAVYGECVASDFKKLETMLPDESGNVHPGLQFSIYAQKKDAYNQTITTDSASIMQAFQSVQQLNSDLIPTKVSGNSIVRMNSGLVIFNLALSPIFALVDFHFGVANLQYEPKLFISGIDSHTSLMMQTEEFSIRINEGSSVCPKGYILDFDILGGKNGSASCSFCKAGTYSVNPLAPLSGSLASAAPSCLNCPIGGDCSLGGHTVTFNVGDWRASDQMYILINCPQGYQLINATENGKFSHGLQECKRCLAGQYIINPNMDSCHTCPEGMSHLILQYCLA